MIHSQAYISYLNDNLTIHIVKRFKVLSSYHHLLNIFTCNTSIEHHRQLLAITIQVRIQDHQVLTIHLKNPSLIVLPSTHRIHPSKSLITSYNSSLYMN